MVAGEVKVLESRLDEISDVFEPDMLALNLTLCDFARVLGNDMRTGRGASMGGIHRNAQADYLFVEVEATLKHGSSKEVMATICRNVSRRYGACCCCALLRCMLQPPMASLP